MMTSIGTWLRNALVLGAGASLLAVAGCDGGAGEGPKTFGPSPEASQPGPGGSEAEGADERVATMMNMLRTAGLEELSRPSKGRTIFAPTNAAFDLFFDQVSDGEACAEYLTKGRGLELLRDILSYHVARGRLSSQDIVGALGQQADGSLEVGTLLSENGGPAELVVTASEGGGGVLDLNGGNATFGGADVVFPDVFVAGGVLHVIDRLLLSPGVRTKLAALPADAACRPKPGDLVSVAASNPDFSTLVDLVGAAGLAGALQGPGPFTVFAPTNAAFAGLLGRVRDGGACVDFLKGDGKAVLQQILTYHVAPGRFGSAQIVAALGQEGDGTLDVKTLLTEGEGPATVAVRAGEGGAALALNGGADELGGAGVVAVDVEASNGVIHVLDGVLLSAGLEAAIGALPASNPCSLPPGDLVSVAASNPDFSTLVDLVGAAGLAGALQGPGPFTVFAPTNAAFSSLLSEVNDGAACVDFLKGDGKAVLQQILTYHVAPGRFGSAQIVAALGQEADGTLDVKTLLTENGKPAKLAVRAGEGGAALALNGGADELGGAGVVAVDVEASNGVIHVLDDVLLSAGLKAAIGALPASNPCAPKPGNLVEVVASNPAFSTLVDLVGAAGLAGALQGPGPFTVFAPTNAAFATFLAGLNDGAACVDFLKDDGKAVLQQILLYHVAPGQFGSSQIVAALGQEADGTLDVKTLLTENGKPAKLAVRAGGGGAALALNGGADELGGAGVVATDVRASNGVAHVLNDVLLSPGLRSTLAHLSAHDPCRPRQH